MEVLPLCRGGLSDKLVAWLRAYQVQLDMVKPAVSMLVAYILPSWLMIVKS